MHEWDLDPARHLHLLPIDSSWYTPSSCQPDNSVPGTPLPEFARTRERFLGVFREHPEVTAVLALNDANARHAWYTLQ